MPSYMAAHVVLKFRKLLGDKRYSLVANVELQRDVCIFHVKGPILIPVGSEFHVKKVFSCYKASGNSEF
jgi:hypothetical protein